jgi:hypothetical protein
MHAYSQGYKYNKHCYTAWLMEAHAVFEEAFEAYVYYRAVN